MVTPEELEENYQKMDVGQDLANLGVELHFQWASLAFKEPPKDLLGRILWSWTVLQQLGISTLTFPAALAAFLLEEAMQTYGMGAYMLSTAKAYDILEPYLIQYKKFIRGAEIGAKNLATLSPMTGGAVVIYAQAAKASHDAFTQANNRNLQKQAETDEKLRQRLLDDAQYGELRISSSPSQAEIWLNGENTGLITPETFKKLDAGTYLIELRRFSVSREEWDIYAFDANVEAGRKREIWIRIPPTVAGDGEKDTDKGDTENPQLPQFIKAAVTGDHALDGDTFETETGERVRLLAIDAPEIGRPWAEEAKEYLGILCENKKLELKIQTSVPVDSYGRTLAIVNSYKGDCSELLLSAGLARLFIADDATYAPERYKAAEDIARSRKIGIWS